MIELGMKIDEDNVRALAANIESRYALYMALKRINRLDLFDPSFLNQQEMALAILSKTDRYARADQKDSITFLEKRFVICKGNKKGYVYFFKRYNPKTKRIQLMHVGLMPEDQSKFDYLNVSMSTGRRLKSDAQSEINQMIDRVMMEFKLYNRNRSERGYAADYYEWDEYDY
jgi:hypothetical protein